jgi:hypothetical protein
MKNKFRLLVFAWAALFAAAMAVSLYAPVPVKVPLLMILAPAANLIAQRILFGRRAARRAWLTYRFVLANITRPDIIAGRGARGGVPR